MILLQIKQIEKIPRFIGKYYNKGVISLKDINEFNSFLEKLNFAVTSDDRYVTTIQDDIPKLLSFYIDKSKLNSEYKCKYEDELDISKSISNELYKFDTIYGSFNATIDYKDEYKCLILTIEDLQV
jgi:hypothetical protein